ncbi:hypothetical protein HDV00_009558 [Rhizophlyctis rosea]|nr:hypothetical protein HDV00_009558 [Rhizophlyctis rosea]
MSYSHFLRDLPNEAIISIFRDYIGEQILIDENTYEYARLRTTDKFFARTLALHLRKELMHRQAGEEATLARVLPYRHYSSPGLQTYRKVLQNPYFDAGKYFGASIFSWKQNHKWSSRAAAAERGWYCLETAPYLRYRPLPEPLRFTRPHPESEITISGEGIYTCERPTSPIIVIFIKAPKLSGYELRTMTDPLTYSCIIIQTRPYECRLKPRAAREAEWRAVKPEIEAGRYPQRMQMYSFVAGRNGITSDLMYLTCNCVVLKDETIR